MPVKDLSWNIKEVIERGQDACAVPANTGWEIFEILITAQVFNIAFLLSVFSIQNKIKMNKTILNMKSTLTKHDTNNET